jgi:hypothetical protein
LQPNKGKQIIFPKSITNENVFVGNEKYFMPKKKGALVNLLYLL